MKPAPPVTRTRSAGAGRPWPRAVAGIAQRDSTLAPVMRLRVSSTNRAWRWIELVVEGVVVGDQDDQRRHAASSAVVDVDQRETDVVGAHEGVGHPDLGTEVDQRPWRWPCPGAPRQSPVLRLWARPEEQDPRTPGRLAHGR